MPDVIEASVAPNSNLYCKHLPSVLVIIIIEQKRGRKGGREGEKRAKGSQIVQKQTNMIREQAVLVRSYVN